MSCRSSNFRARTRKFLKRSVETPAFGIDQSFRGQCQGTTVDSGRMLSEKPWKVDSAVRLLRALFAGFFLGLLMVQGYRSQLGDNTASARLILFSLGVLSFHGVGLALVHVFVREQGTSWREAFGFN